MPVALGRPKRLTTPPSGAASEASVGVVAYAALLTAFETHLATRPRLTREA